jgi:hypothetical protein
MSAVSIAELAARLRHGLVHDPNARIVTTGERVLFDESGYRELDESFPSGILRGGARGAPTEPGPDGASKTYSVHALTLHDHDAWQVDPALLPPPWVGLVDQVVAPAYQNALLEALDADPSDVVRTEVRLAEYRAGGWMSRHTDRPDKVYSHLLYFCPGWQPGWGGDLAFYPDQITPEPFRVIRPGAGTSVAFVRTDHSWHEVVPVASQANRPRRTLLVHGYRS